MKVLLCVFILVIYLRVSVSLNFKKPEIMEITNDLLYSLSLLENNTSLNSFNIHKEENRNQMNIQTEGNILRDEFFKISMNFNHKKKINQTEFSPLYVNKTEIFKKNYLNFIANNSRKISTIIVKNNIQNKTNFSKNKNESIIINNFNKLQRNVSTFLELYSEVENKIKNKQSSKLALKEDRKLLLFQLKNLMEKYIKIKETNDKKKKDIWLPNKDDKNLKNIQDQINEFQVKKNSNTKINKIKKNNKNIPNDKIKQLTKQKKFLEEKIHNKTINIIKHNKIVNKLINVAINNSKEFDIKVKDFNYKHSPKNLIIKQPDIINEEIIPTTLPKEIMQTSNDFLSGQSDNNSLKAFIPVEDCNKKWDYKLHGDDWQCLCQCGKKQSPINVPTNYHKLKELRENIFLDFKEPETCLSDKNPMLNCKLPILKNTGKILELDDKCGILIMPQHLNGYRCYKITFHAASEHKIDNFQFDVEIKIHFRLDDKRIVDQNTMDYIILVILVKGINSLNAKFLGDGPLINHPFLDSLQLDDLPEGQGQAIILKNHLDYSLLFDKSKQPYRIEEKDLKKDMDESNFNLFLNKAFNDLTFNKHSPLEEYYMYNGSFSSPPCEENVTYIINPIFIYAPYDQIQKISKIFIMNGSLNGNNRNLQSIEKIKIYHFKKPTILDETLKDLDLFQKKSTTAIDYNSDEDPNEEKGTHYKNLKEENDLSYIDKLLNSRNSDLFQILEPR